MKNTLEKTKNWKLKIGNYQAGLPDSRPRPLTQALRCKQVTTPAGWQAGQSLISLLFFMVIGITVISAAALIVSADILSTTNAANGTTAYYTAESGIEDGILYLLSHPNTPKDYIIQVGSSTAHVQITYDGVSDTITSTGKSGSTQRIVRTTASYVNGAFTVSNWKEVAN